MTGIFQAYFRMTYTSLIQIKTSSSRMVHQGVPDSSNAAFWSKDGGGVNEAMRGLMVAHQESNSTYSEQKTGETLAEKVVFAGRHKLHIRERDLISIKLHIQVKGCVNQPGLEIKEKVWLNQWCTLSTLAVSLSTCLTQFILWVILGTGNPVCVIVSFTLVAYFTSLVF